MDEDDAGLLAHLSAFADRPDVPSAAAHLMKGAVETIERLHRNLNSRDDFLVGKGLWLEFVDSLPKQTTL